MPSTDYQRCALEAFVSLDDTREADAAAAQLIISGAQMFALLAIAAAIDTLSTTLATLLTEGED